MTSDHLVSGLRERLGISADAVLDEPAILAALDEALSERAEPTPQVPSGTVLVDEQTLTDLRNAAAMGVTARQEQIAERRNQIVNEAIGDGRIAPARRQHWLDALAADQEGTEATLAGLAKGLIPVVSAGYTGGVAESSDDDRIYAELFGKED